MDLPYNASLASVQVSDYDHLQEPLRSDWIRCIQCRTVPTETFYIVSIPHQLLEGRRTRGVSASVCSEACALAWIQSCKLSFVDESKRDVLPTQEQREVWLEAYNEQEGYPFDHPTKSGKWLVWLRKENVDRYWIKIRKAVRAGKLGGWAKVSTAGSKKSAKTGLFVICIYTYDSTDQQDVMRVRLVLRELGLQKPIPYKRNLDTDQLRYGSDYQPMYRA